MIHAPLKAVADFAATALEPLTSAAFKFIIDGINGSMAAITGNPNYSIIEIAMQGFMWMLNQIWTPVATGRETGAELGNAIDAGWDVTANQMCRDVLGCKNISYKQASAEQSQIAAANRADIARRGLIASLFSTDSPQTFGSQLIAMTPTKPSTALANIGTFTTSVISNPMRYLGAIASSISSPSHAVGVMASNEPNGVQQTGYDLAAMDDYNLHTPTVDIAGPVGADGNLGGPDGKIDQYDCPVITDANIPNQCLLDTAAAQTLCASLSDDDDGGLGENGTPGDCTEPGAAPAASATPSDVIARNAESNKPFSFWGFLNWGTR
jgi:hypothetical protein